MTETGRPDNNDLKFNWTDNKFRTKWEAGPVGDMLYERKVRFWRRDSYDYGDFYILGLDVTVDSLTDPRLISPAVSKLFACMVVEGQLAPSMGFDGVDGRDYETDHMISWCEKYGCSWNHRKWPELYNHSDSAQWWRNICYMYDDVRIGYYIIAGALAGICTLDGWGEDGVYYISSERRERSKKRHRRRVEELNWPSPEHKRIMEENDVYTLAQVMECMEIEEHREGVEWMEQQPWFRGCSGKYGVSPWVKISCEGLNNIPSEPKVQERETRERKEMEQKEAEYKRKQDEERKTEEYKTEYTKVSNMNEDECYDYLDSFYDRSETPSLALRDRLREFP
tara:strand:+ start:520 stop:1533 length:1014 start_codon:yes stop_codon:yes gene_type:complete